jgi:cytochrome c oxidase assembly factor CtaG
MAPMAAISVWLLASGAPVYVPYAAALGTTSALHDQRLAGVIMLAATIPTLAVALAAPLAAAGTDSRLGSDVRVQREGVEKPSRRIQ